MYWDSISGGPDDSAIYSQDEPSREDWKNRGSELDWVIEDGDDIETGWYIYVEVEDEEV